MKRALLITSTLVFFMHLAIVSLAQPAFRLNAPISLGMGFSFSRMDTDSGAAWTQGIGGVFQIRAGVGIQFKERAGIDFEGGLFLNAQTFSQGNSEYSVIHYDPQIGCLFYVMMPCGNNQPCNMKFGMGYGFTYVSAFQLEHSEDLFSSITQSEKIRLPYMAPEVGLSSNEGRHSIDLALRYTHHLGGFEMFSTKLFSDLGRSEAKARGNSFGLVVRFRPGLNWKESVKKFSPIVDPPDYLVLREFEGRKTERSKSIQVRRKNITIFIRDNANIDGDTISMSLNGNFILSNYGLGRKPKKIKLPLDYGTNQLIAYAHNEGSVSPNTAECIIRSGWKKFPLILTSSMKRNEAIEIVFEN